MGSKSLIKWVFQGAIVGLMAYFCLMAVLSLHFTQIEAKSNYDRTIRVEKMILERLKFSVEMYSYQKGELPSDLSALVPEYLPKLPTDRWGKEYLFTKSDKRFEIKTLGEDGLPGGKGHKFDFSTNTIWEQHFK